MPNVASALASALTSVSANATVIVEKTIANANTSARTFFIFSPPYDFIISWEYIVASTPRMYMHPRNGEGYHNLVASHQSLVAGRWS